MDYKNAFIDDLLYSVNDFKKIKYIAWLDEPFSAILALENPESFSYEDKLKLFDIIKDLCDEYEYEYDDFTNRLNIVEDIVSTGKYDLKYNYLDE
jgi:hypothetical protein